MKQTLFVLLIIFVSISSCQQQKAKQQQEAVNEMLGKNSPDKEDQAAAPSQPSSFNVPGNPLMGEWKTVLVTADNNSNGMLDPEEKEKGFSTYDDYLRLNPDGTCEYT